MPREDPTYRLVTDCPSDTVAEFRTTLCTADTCGFPSPTQDPCVWPKCYRTRTCVEKVMGVTVLSHRVSYARGSCDPICTWLQVPLNFKIVDGVLSTHSWPMDPFVDPTGWQSPSSIFSTYSADYCWDYGTGSVDTACYDAWIAMCPPFIDLTTYGPGFGGTYTATATTELYNVGDTFTYEITYSDEYTEAELREDALANCVVNDWQDFTEATPTAYERRTSTPCGSLTIQTVECRFRNASYCIYHYNEPQGGCGSSDTLTACETTGPIVFDPCCNAAGPPPGTANFTITAPSFTQSPGCVDPCAVFEWTNHRIEIVSPCTSCT